VNLHILGIGEILWDILPDRRLLGGAPANFSFRAHNFGADARPVSCVGEDTLGREILERLSGLGLPTDGIALDAAKPTGTVTVELAADGQPRYVIHEDVAWDYLRLTPAALAAAALADAVCFGTLAQRSPISRAAIRTLLAATRADALRVFDINLRQNFYTRELIEQSLRLANVVKLNDEELPMVAAIFDLGADVRAQLVTLAQRFKLAAIALTRSARGSLLLAAEQWSEHPGQPVRVVDTIGAGDAFTAAFIVGLCLQRPLDDINRIANEVAAHVCTQAGGTGELPPHLRDAFKSGGGSRSRRSPQVS
jgi:fructokinase